MEELNNVPVDQKRLLLNLGSGPVAVEGWIACDSGLLPLLSKIPFALRTLVALNILPEFYDRSWPSIKLVDLRKKLPFESESVAGAYCSHVIEHLDFHDACNLVSEVQRVLKPGGFFRIVVPDINLICENFKNAGASNTKACLEFNHSIWGEDRTAPTGFLERLLTRFFSRPHKFHYDAVMLRHMVERAGFKKNQQCEFRIGTGVCLEQLDLEEHRFHSIYFEAIK